MNNIHKKLQPERWGQMSLAEQMANIGSEYGRAKKWRAKNQDQLFWSAFSRMLELMDLTINDIRWQNYRLKELCRLRELICEELLDKNSKMTDFFSYFMSFNILARR